MDYTRHVEPDRRMDVLKLKQKVLEQSYTKKGKQFDESEADEINRSVAFLRKYDTDRLRNNIRHNFDEFVKYRYNVILIELMEQHKLHPKGVLKYLENLNAETFKTLVTDIISTYMEEGR